MSEKWTADDIPDQSGRTALVTGANSGLGLQTTKALAGAGATVLMACRNAEKARSAREAIVRDNPAAAVEVVALDLGDLASVERAAGEVAAREDDLDLLVNNAGVMAPPRRQTVDGFELQLGTNHLGHFALTGRLLEKLLAARAPRVVTVSSVAHRQGKMDFEDLNWERSYSRWPAYGRSKLANLLFTAELSRRAAAADSELIAAAAHPGYASTGLQTAGPGMGPLGVIAKPFMKVGNLLLAQSDANGALPSLYAATAPDVAGSEYFGPDGIAESRGHPHRVGRSGRASDPADAKRLWEASVKLTGVSYNALDRGAAKGA
ncbi:MAG: oxidoreductase [Actinomycetota bacterium]|nr:oxidoreductase [Actinomycetota bacterium]